MRQCGQSIAIVLSIAGLLGADDRTKVVQFENEVRPVLVNQCLKCHGPEKQEAGLRLDSRAAILKGGDTGPAIVAGKPQDSLLISALRHEELEMPPNGRLEERQIVAIEKWVSAGATWPDNNETLRPPGNEISDKDRAWWAFQPLAATPTPVESAWNAANEIDDFVHRKLSDVGLSPAPTAEKATLIRRLYQATIGLPPSPDEIQEFVDNESPTAYEDMVDQLLDDELYGEHWAVFWLDLVRYAESDGWKADGYRPNMWRYRDYVVNAFNQDKPYPEFVREQLAGDELDDPSPEALAATGYLRLGIYEYNQRNSRQHWEDILNEVTDVTADVFLGLGMACARCHDHKFDPILQEDYFKLRAFFEPIVFADDVRYATKEQIAEYERQHHVWKTKASDVRKRIDVLLKPYHDKKWKATVDKFPLEIQASFFKPLEQRNSWDQQMAYFVGRQFYEEGGGPLQSMKGDDKETHEALKKELKVFDASKPKELPSLMSVTNFDGEYAQTKVPGRDESISPGFLRVLADTFGPEYPEPSRRRRTQLAHWITSDQNALASRVIVNRIWKQHFGRGLVSSVSDFGHLGGQPSHPELLDWLTVQFVNDDWSFKQLHKHILMSSTWRQAAHHPQATEYEERDPENRYLWRSNVRRLTAEQIRDAMLFSSGELVAKRGGPSVTQESPRRGLYVKSFRNLPDRFMHSFDKANGLKSVGQRNSTTTPTQALMMLNGEFVVGRAEEMARRLALIEDPNERASMAVQLTWNRKPNPSELRSSLEFMKGDSTETQFQNLFDFCHVLLNSNEFLYVD